MRLSPAVQRFLRYAAVGVSTLAFDLGMLYGSVHWLGVPYYVATPISFLITVSCNYVLSRKIVFSHTERRWHSGYAYFALVSAAGALITTAFVAGLVTFLGLNFLTARVIVAGFIGVGNYLFNLYVNFNVAGKHTKD